MAWVVRNEACYAQTPNRAAAETAAAEAAEAEAEAAEAAGEE